MRGGPRIDRHERRWTPVRRRVLMNRGIIMNDRNSCLNPTDLDVLVARVRAHAATTGSGQQGAEAQDVPFSCRFKGIDTALKQDIDIALLYQTPFATPAAGRMRRLKGVAKDLLRRVWSWQTTLNTSLVSATVGLSDKTTALVVEIETLEARMRELEDRLESGQRGDSKPDSALR